MRNYTAYTGTFTNKKGQVRTMTFIRQSDVPSSILGTGKSPNLSEGYETVYDVNANGWRTFNHNTQVGQLSTKSINFSFDKSN